MIDYEELGNVEDCCWGWRSAFPSLGDIYVPGEGGGRPMAFIIGEAPGAQEVMHRRPFVGPAGRVLRDLMSVAGLRATEQWSNGSDDHPETIGAVAPNCWLTNVVKFRPPGNRKPTESEIKTARASLRQEWVAVGRPDIIIPVGGIALEAVLGKCDQSAILRTAGKCHTAMNKDGHTMYIWPMLHPSVGLRKPSMRTTLERDWELLGEWIDGTYQRTIE